MKNAKEFLELCRRRFPSTRPHQCHRLELRGDTLVLTLLLGDTFQEFDIHEGDLEKPAPMLLSEVARLYKRPPGSPVKPKKVPPDDIA